MGDSQSAYGLIGDDYIPQIAMHGQYYYEQPRNQLIGQYDKGYDAMLFLPLAAMLILLFCICCFLTNAVIGASCYFFGKQMNEKNGFKKVNVRDDDSEYAV